jgi:uncharacterized membrane protein YcgQ (UPF0703/DUF1980 family)
VGWEVSGDVSGQKDWSSILFGVFWAFRLLSDFSGLIELLRFLWIFSGSVSAFLIGLIQFSIHHGNQQSFNHDHDAESSPRAVTFFVSLSRRLSKLMNKSLLCLVSKVA